MKLAIVAGEASGDLHAAEVRARAEEPRSLARDVRHRRRSARARRDAPRCITRARWASSASSTSCAICACSGASSTRLIDAIAREKPDAVLLVDYPGFNLRVARRCKELGIRVVYYISPQLWAWRRGRVKQIAKYVDRMIVIFPFEEDFLPRARRRGDVRRPSADRRDRTHRSVAPKTRRRLVAASRCCPDRGRPRCTSLLPAMLDAVRDPGARARRRRVRRSGADDSARAARRVRDRQKRSRRRARQRRSGRRGATSRCPRPARPRSNARSSARRSSSCIACRSPTTGSAGWS